MKIVLILWAALLATCGAVKYPTAENIEAFHKWFKKMPFAGDYAGNFTLGQRGEGLFAARDFKANETVFCMPLPVSIAPEAIESSAMGRVLKDAKPLAKRKVTAAMLKALFLARMRYRTDPSERVSQLYAGYVGAFPWHLGSAVAQPLWSAAARQELQSLSVPQRPWREEYDLVRKEVLLRYPKVFGSPPAPEYSFENFTQVYAAMSARWFPHEKAPADANGMRWTAEVVCPVLDMIRDGVSTHTIGEANGRGYCLITGSEVRRGEELVVPRAWPPVVSSMLGLYGVIRESHSHDIFLLSVTPDWYAGILLQPPYDNFYSFTDGEFEVHVTPDHFPGELLAHERLTALARERAVDGEINVNELLSLRDAVLCKNETIVFGRCGISFENEEEARDALINRFERLLAKHSTTEATDEEILASLRAKSAADPASVDPNVILAVDYRRRIKRTIRINIEWLKKPYRNAKSKTDL